MPSSVVSAEKRFIKLRDVIFEHYKKTLLIKRKERLTSIRPATSSPVAVIPEVNTAEASRSVIIASPPSTKCDTDVNDVTGNDYAEPSVPGVSNSANEPNQNISQSLFDNNSLFEEEYGVLKSESQSESDMEDLLEDKASDSGGEVNDQVMTSASPPGPSKPLRKTRKRMSNTGKSTLSSKTAQRKRPNPMVIIGRGMFEGTEYKILRNKTIKCGCCNHIYSSTDFKRHVRKEIHQCSVCKKIFTLAYSLKQHHYEIHGAGRNKKFPCPNCDHQYSRRRDLNTHLRNACW